jgi:hypothetical protein
MAFGALALFLSILGTYSLLAYDESLCEKEIGFRLALGSSRQKIVPLLLHEAGRWLVAGMLLGLACSVISGYIVQTQSYGAHFTPPSVLLGSALLMLLPALLAIALRARRSAIQDPSETLGRE